MELGKNQRWKERKEGEGRGKREESSSKKGGCRFSNCNETRHRRVAWVSYDDETTDDDAVFLSPRILLFIPYDTNFVFRGNCKPAANYEVILFHILAPYSFHKRKRQIFSKYFHILSLFRKVKQFLAFSKLAGERIILQIRKVYKIIIFVDTSPFFFLFSQSQRAH